MDYVISGDISSKVYIKSYTSIQNIKTIRSQRNILLGECPGMPGVRIKLQDLSDFSPDTNTTSIAGIVGYSNRGQFNKIHQIRNSGDLSNLGSFNSYKYNQGIYSANAVLENNGFVEYVRPYSEEIVTDSIDKQSLKSDVFVVSYDYNQNTNKSIAVDFFAATRYNLDGYSIYGNREIYNIEDVLINNSEYNFSLNKTEVQNKISLFSIINLDPTEMNRAKNNSTITADRLFITTANYRQGKTITQTLELSNQPLDGDIIHIFDHNGLEYKFEFDNDLTVTSGNIQVTIGANLSQTINNLIIAFEQQLENISFSVISNSIVASVEYGIDDIYNEIIHENIFYIDIDVGNVISINTSTITDDNILVDDSIGRLFLSLGACQEIVKKPSISSASVVQYMLNEKGNILAKIFILVDYVLDSANYTFYGTIIPHVVSGINLYIVDRVNTLTDSFKLIINSHLDLTNAVQAPEFNLGNSINVIQVEAATTSNITLNGLFNIDGVLITSGDLVLVKDQTNLSKNGVYVASTGEWSRYFELSKTEHFNSDVFIEVKNGNLNSDSKWKVSTSEVFTVDLSSVNFFQTTLDPMPVSTFMFNSYNENDPAIINNSIWIYSPKKQNTSMFKYAWKLFLDKSKSNCDYLVSSGTNIKNLFIRGFEELDADVMKSMLEVCNYRKDCFCIFDGVDESNIDNAIIKMAGAGAFGYMSRWGAIFDGRSYFYDSKYTKMETIAVKTVEVAALITKNRRGGLYWIPACGKEYGTISPIYSSKQKYTRRGGSVEDPNTEIGKIYGFHINPSKTIDGLTVIFGDKTLFKEDSDCNRLHVTMLVAGLHKKLPNLLVPLMLKLNTLLLRSKLKEEMSLILNSIKRASPSGLDRFDIICDNSNNTNETISDEKFIVDVRIYPTKTSECIVLRTTMERTDGSLSVANFEVVR